MPEAVIVSVVRTPVGRAPKGALSTTRPDDLAALAVNGALDKIPALSKAERRFAVDFPPGAHNIRMNHNQRRGQLLAPDP